MESKVRVMHLSVCELYLAVPRRWRAVGPEQTRTHGMREFVDEKKFRPGLEPLKRPASEK